MSKLSEDLDLVQLTPTLLWALW